MSFVSDYFLWPWSALLLLLAPFLTYFAHSNNILKIYFPFKQESFHSGKKIVFKKINWLFFLSFLFLVTALMRPITKGEPIISMQEGRAIMLAVDISESMNIDDMNWQGSVASRLFVVKELMKDFILRRQGDALGLVLFGSTSFLHAPLSFDTNTIAQFLMEAETGFLGPKTAIGDALGIAVKNLHREKEQHKESVIVLLTDGQNNSGYLDPMKAATLAREAGIKIYIIGVGSNKMTVMGLFGAQNINPSQDLERYEQVLNFIAHETGGTYFRAKTTLDIENIYKQIDELEPTVKKDLAHTPINEYFYIFLFLALITILIARVYKI